MRYTVKQLAELTGVTIKALHHYHKIKLLEPCEVTEAGYRLYGTEELEQLQQILFYKELDFPLQEIKQAMADEPNRLRCLVRQQEALRLRKQRMHRLLITLEDSIRFAEKGEHMDQSQMFQGLNKEEWEAALSEQNSYLKENYEYDMLVGQEIDPEQLNEAAQGAEAFMSGLAQALRDGWSPTDERLQELLAQHIVYLNELGFETTAKSFVDQAAFFVEDDFHRNMMESQQTGMSYYLYTAAVFYRDKDRESHQDESNGQ
ncbi:MerR family transcriptional regulator [Paenibacillus sp. NPDC057967]|uniref:MerR family transcriptional regulator n=1 Tax=Paenibacillus sp. NPDC057967 TaxID=3346293 RepID=UPI0036DBFE79